MLESSMSSPRSGGTKTSLSTESRVASTASMALIISVDVVCESLAARDACEDSAASRPVVASVEERERCTGSSPIAVATWPKSSPKPWGDNDSTIGFKTGSSGGAAAKRRELIALDGASCSLFAAEVFDGLGEEKKDGKARASGANSPSSGVPLIGVRRPPTSRSRCVVPPVCNSKYRLQI